jgi:Arc/MetJ-type ribon-helix-helix transcriptional regulator
MRKGNVSSIYLTENEWELLDDLTRNYKFRNRSEMIRMLINHECEKAGYINVNLEEIEKKKLNLQSEINKLNEQAERVKIQQPLISAREQNYNVEYDEAIDILIRLIERGDNEVDVERVAKTRAKVYLKNKWTADELISKATSIIEERKMKSLVI